MPLKSNLLISVVTLDGKGNLNNFRNIKPAIELIPLTTNQILLQI